MRAVLDFPNVENKHREDPYMYKEYSKKLKEMGYTVHKSQKFRFKQDIDLFIAFKPRYYPNGFLERISKTAKMVYIYPDARNRPDPRVVQWAKEFEYFLGVDKDGMEMYREIMPNLEYRHFLQGVNIESYETKQYEYDPEKIRRMWSFIGSYYTGRDNFYRILQRHRSSGRVWGNMWQKCPYDIEWAGSDVYNKQYSTIAKKGRFMLNKSLLPNNYGSWSTRVYKAMTSSSVLLTDRVKGLNDFFKEGEHYLAYDDLNHLSNILKKPEEYFTNEELLSVSKNGYKEVKKNHTYKQRAEELVELIKL